MTLNKVKRELEKCYRQIERSEKAKAKVLEILITFSKLNGSRRGSLYDRSIISDNRYTNLLIRLHKLI